MLNPYNTNLPPDLRALKEEIEGYARLRPGLFRDNLEVIDADDLNGVPKVRPGMLVDPKPFHER